MKDSNKWLSILIALLLLLGCSQTDVNIATQQSTEVSATLVKTQVIETVPMVSATPSPPTPEEVVAPSLELLKTLDVVGRTLNYSPLGTSLAVAGEDGRRKILLLGTDYETIQLELQVPIRDFEIPEGFDLAREGVMSLAFSPDGKMLAVGTWEWRIYIWDVETGELILTHARSERIPSLEFSYDSRILGYLFEQSEYIYGYLLNIENRVANEELSEVPISPSVPLEISFSPTDPVFATANITEEGNPEITIIDFEDCEIKFPCQTKILDNLFLGNKTGSVRSVDFAPDGKSLAAVIDSNLRIWDIEKAAELPVPQEINLNRLIKVRFGSNGVLALLDESNSLHLVDFKLGAIIGEVEDTIFWSFSPDGVELATIDKNGIVRIWLIP